MRRLFFALAVILLVTLSAVAQQPPELERGFKPELAYQFNGFDSVNLFNGNLNLGIPLGSYSVASDVSYSFVLRYSGNVWGYYYDCKGGIIDPDPPPCVPIWYPMNDNGGLGWQLSFGRLEFTHSLYGEQLPSGGTVKYVSPDGGEHNFYETLHEPKCAAGVTSSNTCDPVFAGVFYTRDGSYLRLKVVGGDRIVEFPDGQRQRFEHIGGVNWRLKYIYGVSSTLDGDGYPTTKWVKFERVTKNIPDKPWLSDTKITDSRGRTHWLIYHDADPYLGQIDKVQIAAPSPATVAEYDLTYGNYTLDGSGSPVNGGLVSIPKPCHAENLMPVPFLSRIDLPLGDKWEFVNETSLSNCTSPGTLTRAAMPTGGNVSWSYQDYPFTTPDGITAATGVKERCLRRDANPCSLTNSPLNQEQYSKYTRAGSTVSLETYSLNSTNTAWGLDTKAVNYFTVEYGSFMSLPFTTAETDGTSTARDLSSQVFDCNPNTGSCDATPERKQYVKYEMDATAVCDPIFPCGRDRNRRVVSERTLFVEDGDGYADTDRTLFDGLGHYRETITRGFDDNEPRRESYVGFNNNTRGWSAWSGSSVGIYGLNSAGARLAGFTMLDPADSWILGTHVTAYTRENGSTSHSEACFDPTTGFLHRMRLKGHSTGGNLTTDLLRVYTRDADTGYAPQEEYFGGDAPSTAQDIPPGSLCTLTPPAHDQYSYKINHTYQGGVLKTSQFDGMAWKSVENSIIDDNTGLVLQSKDPAGLATSYQYDKQRRLTLVSPPGVSSMSYTYVPVSGATPARVEALTGSGTTRTEQKWEFDPFGRVAIEKRLMPPGIWSVRKTTYNHIGQRASVSEWENETGATYANRTTFSNFDPFGRVGSIATPDSKTTTFDYDGERVTTRSYEVAKPAGDAIVSIEELRDRSGRLIQVIEDTSGIAAKTDYTYDEGNRLATVKMWDGAASQPLRVFNYNLRGLLTSETHPESGITSYTYDSRGNAITKITPEDSLTNTYDDAGRTLTVTDVNLADFLKAFTYEPATGRLQTATRYNRSTELGEVTVSESYQYNGLGGRMSRKDTTVQRPSGETAQFYDQYTYNSLGDLASLTYPMCALGTCTSLSAPSRVISPTYRYGLVSDVAPYTQGFQNTTGITYYPNGLVDTIEHKNVNGTAGPRLKQTIASNKMARVDSITVTNFCDNLSVTAPAPQPKSVPYGSAAGLSVTATGATGYQWYRIDSGGNHVFLSGQTSSTLTAPVTETSVYFVRVGNGSCTVDSERGTVTLQACTAPDATITAPSSMTASTTTTASVPVTPGATYSWSISGGTILSGQGTSQITFRASCSGAVNLSVTVTSGGCSAADTHSVAINPATVSMTVVGPSTILQNGAAQIRLTFSGTNPWYVTWSDTPASPQTYSSSPITRTVFPGVTTTSYSVTADDGHGCMMSVSGAPVTITVKPLAPTTVVATASATTQVNVTWSFSGSADRFDVYRAGALIGNAPGSVFTFNDVGAAPSTAYVYTVRAVKANTPSDPSMGDLATTVIFVDDPIVSFTTPIKAQHITQLQTAVNAVRAAAGLGPQSFATITPGVTIVLASHFESLRTALAPARAAPGLPAIGYSRSPLTPGMLVLAADVNETRGGVR